MVRIAALTNLGRWREVNEDAASLLDLATGWSVSGCDLRSSLTSRAAVVGVYDGTGQSQSEGPPSRIAARIVCEHLSTPPLVTTREELSRILVGGLQAAAREISDYNHRTRSGLGTTATVAGVIANDVVIAHVGDSRAYLLSRGVLGQVTRDDTLINDYLELANVTAEEFDNFPHRSVVTRVLGFPPDEDAAMTSLAVRAGDVLLLCTDGISGMLDDAAIAAILDKERDPEAACRALVDAAEGAGGSDNETAVVARFDVESG